MLREVRKSGVTSWLFITVSLVVAVMPLSAKGEWLEIVPHAPTQYDSITLQVVGWLPGCPCMGLDSILFDPSGDTIQIGLWWSVRPGNCACEAHVYICPFELGVRQAGRYAVRLRVFGNGTADATYDMEVRHSSLRVPDDYLTIQAAVDAVLPGDTVLVAPGTYTGDGNRDIDFGGKNTIVRSEAGPDFTIIDCQGSNPGPHRGFYFHSGETREALIEGFTIINGNAPVWPEYPPVGGGIACVGASPTIRNNRIGNCWAVDFECGLGTCYLVGGAGGGIFCQDSDALIEGNTVDSCSLGNIFCERGNPTVRGNTVMHATTGSSYYGVKFKDAGTDALISNNRITGNEGAGIVIVNSDIRVIGNLVNDNEGTSAVACRHSNATLQNNTIVNNHRNSIAPYYGDGVSIVGGSPVLIANIIAFNQRSSIACSEGATPVLECNDIFGNGSDDWDGCIAAQFGSSGNISADPLFCDPENGDYSLDITSPCAWRHNECQETIGAYDVGCGSYICGDTDYDGQVTSADVTLLANAYFDRSAPWPFPIATGDLNCNGLIELNDLVLLAGWVHGYGPTPCCSGDNKKRETLSEGDSGSPVH